MSQDKIKILMGLHPHAGWRSFKTSTDVSILNFEDEGLIVYDGRAIRYVGLTTKFGHALLLALAQSPNVPVDRLRFRQKQFEIYLAEDGSTWDERLTQILHYIAFAHSDTDVYVVEVIDMSGGEPRWDIDPDGEELEEIDERADSFVVN